MRVSTETHHSSWGSVGNTASDEGLPCPTLPCISTSVTLAPQPRRFPGTPQGGAALTAALADQLDRCFAGQEVDGRGHILDLRLVSRFQRRVWQVVRGIPRGQVRSYTRVGVQAGSPKGARAVGRAMTTNPYPIVVRCHRVVGGARSVDRFWRRPGLQTASAGAGSRSDQRHAGFDLGGVSCYNWLWSGTSLPPFL